MYLFLLEIIYFLLNLSKFGPRAQGLGPSGGRTAVRTTVGRRNGPGPMGRAHGPMGQGPWALAQSPITDHAENYFSEFLFF